jgi:hypothetical protein
MAGKSDAFKYNLLVHIFNGTAISNWNTTGGTTTLWVGLHTADPTDSGSTANEGGYTQYTRASANRSTAGFAVTSGTSAAATVAPAAAMSFPQNTSTSTGTFSYFTVWNSSSSSSPIYTGAVSPTINFSQNVTPQVTTSSSITED